MFACHRNAKTTFTVYLLLCQGLCPQTCSHSPRVSSFRCLNELFDMDAIERFDSNEPSNEYSTSACAQVLLRGQPGGMSCKPPLRVYKPPLLPATIGCPQSFDSAAGPMKEARFVTARLSGFAAFSCGIWKMHGRSASTFTVVRPPQSFGERPGEELVHSAGGNCPPRPTDLQLPSWLLHPPPPGPSSVLSTTSPDHPWCPYSVRGPT